MSDIFGRIYRGLFAPHPEWVLGMRVVIEPVLPLVPSDGENARRTVRHGMKDVLRWLGEEVGPAPYEETHCVCMRQPYTGEQVIFMSRKLYTEIRLGVDLSIARPFDDRGKDALQTVWTARDRALRAGIL